MSALYSATLYSATLYSATLYSATLYSATLYSAALLYIVQHCAMLSYVALHAWCSTYGPLPA